MGRDRRRGGAGGRRGGRSGGNDGGDPPGPDRVGDLLSGLFSKWGLKGELERQDSLVRWPEIVGEGIAKVTRPRGVARGVLYVEVRSSAWITELNLMRHEFMRRLNAGKAEGRVERIVFVLAEDPDSASSHESDAPSDRSDRTGPAASSGRPESDPLEPEEQ